MAGSFRDCWVMEILGGNGWVADNPFCLSAGYVGYSLTEEATAGSQPPDAVLVRWIRAALPE